MEPHLGVCHRTSILRCRSESRDRDCSAQGRRGGVQDACDQQLIRSKSSPQKLKHIFATNRGCLANRQVTVRGLDVPPEPLPAHDLYLEETEPVFTQQRSE